MILLGRVGIEAEVELVAPAEFEARLAQRIIAHLGGGVALGEVSRVSGQLVGDHAHLHIVAIGQAKVFLGGNVAEHRRAVPADLRRTDAAGDVVVTGRDVGDERPERVERRFAAHFQLLVHVFLDLVHRHVARPFDHHLHILCPGAVGQLAQRVELGELGLVIGIGDRTGTQAVAQRIGDVIGLHDLGDLVEMLVEEAFLVVRQAPFRHDRAAAADDARHAVGGERDIGQPDPGVDGEIVDALLGLLDQRIAEDLPGQFLGNAADLLERLVDRHGADWHGRVADDPFARVVDVAAGRKVHHRIRAPADRPDHLVDFAGDVGRDCGIADIGVDLDQEVAADRHRLAFGVVDVRGDDGTAARHFVTHEFGRDDVGDRRAPALRAGAVGGDQLGSHLAPQVLALGHIFHLGRDDAAAGIMHLGDVHPRLRAQHALCHIGEGRHAAAAIGPQLAVVFRPDLARGIFLDVAARQDPLAAPGFKTLGDVDRDRGIGVGAGCVIDPHARLASLEIDLAHGDADAAAGARADMNLAAAADRPGGDANLDRGIDIGHAKSLHVAGERTAGRHRSTPSADANRFRFDGSCGAYPHLSATRWLPGDDPS